MRHGQRHSRCRRQLRNPVGGGIFIPNRQRLLREPAGAFAVSTLRKYQALSVVAMLAAPLGLGLTWAVPPAWSNVSAISGLVVSVVCVFAMALLRCPSCHHQLGLGEAAREFQSHCCPHCGADLRK
jgi:hypothetical protein